MTTLSLLIKSEPAVTTAALRFAKASSYTDAHMHCVFFYGKGVLHATGPEKQFWSDWSRSVGALFSAVHPLKPLDWQQMTIFLSKVWVSLLKRG